MTEPNYPDSRRFSYGSIIIAAALVIQLIGWGTFGTFGIFINQFQADLGWTRAAISGVASIVMLVHGLFSIIMGNISDRYGPRIVMTACSIIFATGVFLTSYIRELWQLYLTWGVVAGIGISGFDVVVLSTIARWFDKKRSTINGIVKAGAGVGHLLLPVLAGALIVALGWRGTYVILAIICLVVIVVAAQFLKRDPRKLPDGGKTVTQITPTHSPEEGLTFSSAIRISRFWVVVSAYATSLFCTYTIQVHIAPHAIDLGSSVTQAAGMLSIIGASSIVGRFAMGGVGDRIGNVKTMMLCTILLAITLLSLGFVQQTWVLYTILPIYGIAHGGIYSLISPMIAGLFGTGSHGANYGLIIFGGTIGGAIGPLVAGYIFDNMSSYHIVFFILAIVALVSVLLLSKLKPVKVKE